MPTKQGPKRRTAQSIDTLAPEVAEFLRWLVSRDGEPDKDGWSKEERKMIRELREHGLIYETTHKAWLGRRRVALKPVTLAMAAERGWVVCKEDQ